MSSGAQTLSYRRSRFSTRLPLGRLYTPSHYWLLGSEDGLWRVGFTKFATRMLGELVEYRFEPEATQRVELGQRIGWVEGFKALSEVYSVATGAFSGSNPAIEGDITLVDSDSYGDGWLYEVRGEPDVAAVDAQGYATLLDATIEKMLEKQGGDAHGE